MSRHTVKGYLKSAAKAFANATLNIQKFAECYVEARRYFPYREEEVIEAFKAAYPIFGEREWNRLWMVGNYILLPQFMFKSDLFVCKLLRMKNHMKWQQALVSASEDGTLRVDRGNGPEKVKLSELTKKEEKVLAMLLSENDSKKSPEDLIATFGGIMRKINKTKRKKGKRTPREILDDMSAEVVKYSSLRDDEWDFEERHGNREMWDEDVDKEHEELLDDIQKSRDRLTKLVREATGNKSLTV